MSDIIVGVLLTPLVLLVAAMFVTLMYEATKAMFCIWTGKYDL